MSVDDNNTHSPARTRPSRRFPKTKPRKTVEFSVVSEEHQKIVREALQDRIAIEPMKWKRNRLAWLIRRLGQTIEAHGRK